MRHTDIVASVDRLVSDSCADSVKDALAAVCAARYAKYVGEGDTYEASLWATLADKISAVPNLGI